MNIDGTFGTRPERARWASREWAPALKARSTTARFSAPEKVSNSVRADRIAARLSVMRATGASAGMRIGHHAHRSARLGPVERILEIGAGKDRCGVPVGAHAEPDKIQRPVELGELRIGGLARRPVVGRSLSSVIGRTRAPFGRKRLAIIAALLKGSVDRNQAVVGGDDRHSVPIDRVRPRAVRRPAIGDLPPGSAMNASPRASSAAFDDDADIAERRHPPFRRWCHSRAIRASIMPAHSVALGQARWRPTGPRCPPA